MRIFVFFFLRPAISWYFDFPSFPLSGQRHGKASFWREASPSLWSNKEIEEGGTAKQVSVPKNDQRIIHIYLWKKVIFLQDPTTFWKRKFFLLITDCANHATRPKRGHVPTSYDRATSALRNSCFFLALKLHVTMQIILFCNCSSPPMRVGLLPIKCLALRHLRPQLKTLQCQFNALFKTLQSMKTKLRHAIPLHW